MSEQISDLYKFPESGFVRQSDLLEILPFSAATLWRRVRAKKFPRPIKLSQRVTAWRVSEIKAHLDALVS